MILVLTEKSSQVKAIKPIARNFRQIEQELSRCELEGRDTILCSLQGHIFEDDEKEYDPLNFVPKMGIIKRVPNRKGGLGKIHNKLKYIQQNFLGSINTVLILTDPDMEGARIAKDVIDYYHFDKVNEIIFADMSNTSEKALRKVLKDALINKKDYIDWERMAFASGIKANFNLTGFAVTKKINQIAKEKKYSGVFYTFGTQQIRTLSLIVNRYRKNQGADKRDKYRLVAKTSKGNFKVALDSEKYDPLEKEIIQKKGESLVGSSITIKKTKKTLVKTLSHSWYDGSELGGVSAKEAKVSMVEVYSSKTSAMQKLYENGVLTYLRGEAQGKMPLIDLEEYQNIARHIAPFYYAPQLDTSIIKEAFWRDDNVGKKKGEKVINHVPCTLAKEINIDDFSGLERTVIDVASKHILSTFYPDPIDRKYKIEGVLVSDDEEIVFTLDDTEGVELGWREIYGTKKLSELKFKDIGSIKEGDELIIESVEVETFKEKAPALFNEHTLLKVLKKKSIGAESTFGNLVDFAMERQEKKSKENSKKKEFLNRGYFDIDKKGSIIPTEKAMFFYDSLPNDIRDILPIFEGDILNRFLQDSITEGQFINANYKISKELYEGIVNIFEKKLHEFAKFGGRVATQKKEYQKLEGAVCPICGGEVLLKSKTAQCVNMKFSKDGKPLKDGCSFSIFIKDEKYLKYTLTKEEVEAILNQGSIHKEVTKNDIKIKAKMKLDDNKSKLEVIY